jgi:glycosyltransferase involved in cell wall biosynthesis
MKIAFVSDVVYPYVKGGAEKRIHEMSGRLSAHGNEVHVYSIKWWEGPSILVKDGITYHGVCRARKLYSGDRRSIIEAVLFGVSLILPLLRERFDVIDCNQHPYFSIFSSKIVSLIKGGKFFVTWHEYWGDYWYRYLGIAGSIGKSIEAISSMLPGHIISVSGRTASDLTKAGISEGKISVVNNGIDIRLIDQIKPSGENHDIVFAGRLIKEKNIRELLIACSAVKDIIPGLKVLIIGEGPEMILLKDMAEELDIKDNVTFAGRMEEQQLFASIKSSKVFVLPSSREGFSISTLEALACGVPVITVKNEKNYASELIKDGVTGLIVSPGHESLKDGILKLLKDDKLRETMSKECPGSVKGYDWGVLADKLLKVYHEQQA